MANALYYGNNLRVLRHEIASDRVDLIYLDLPFNSQANYNLLFKSPAGTAADAQIEAFEVPKIQIITLAELFQGKRPRIPRIDSAATFRTAARENSAAQGRLL